MRSGEEMAPTKKGAIEGEENSPRSGVKKNHLPEGRGPLVEAGGLIGYKL